MSVVIGIAQFILGTYLFIYAFLHILIYIYPFIANYAIFMHIVNLPFRELDNPTWYELYNVHNFYLETDEDVKVGIWHFIPEQLEYSYKLQSKTKVKEHFDLYFKINDDRPVIIYSHGNAGDRAKSNRIGLCKRLAKQGYHVFAIDYRGFGDSTGWPSEDGAVKDVLTLFNFIKTFQAEKKVYLWGHSLGTGISAHASKILSDLNNEPDGLVLEAPFLNITKAAKDFHIAPFVLNNPWIIKKGEEALESINLRLSTDENIVKIKSKILILHAVDDWTIPIAHSIGLVNICKQNRPKDYPPVKYIEYHKDLGLGHNRIYTHEDLYGSVKEFIGR